MTWSACDLLVIISSLDSKWQVLKVGMPGFHLFFEMKLKTFKFKVLAFWSQWRYHDQIQITSSSYHKNSIVFGRFVKDSGLDGSLHYIYQTLIVHPVHKNLRQRNLLCLITILGKKLVGIVKIPIQWQGHSSLVGRKG